MRPDRQKDNCRHLRRYARHGARVLRKDPSKVDRSASYAARYVAKNLVAAGLADNVEIQLSYAIGVATPTSVSVNSFGTGKLSDEELCDIVRKEFDLRPAGIIRMLDLKRPILSADGGIRTFRQRGSRASVGEDGPRGKAEELPRLNYN